MIRCLQSAQRTEGSVRGRRVQNKTCPGAKQLPSHDMRESSSNPTEAPLADGKNRLLSFPLLPLRFTLLLPGLLPRFRRCGPVGVRPIKHDDAADRLDDLHARRSGGQRLPHLPRRRRGGFQYLDLDQLARVERVLQRTDGGFRDAFLADVQDGLERVRKRLELRTSFRS